MNPPVNLSEGAISMMTSGEAQVADMKPVLQVADVRLVNTQNPNTANERYRILLSDGEFLQQGMLYTQRNDLVRSQQLQKGSIIRLTQFVCNVIQSRMIVIMIELDVILQKCGPIGMPKQFRASPMANQSSKFPIFARKMHPPVSLTKGAISMMINSPLLQVADIWRINTENHSTADERYLILLSDGELLHEGMLATQRNDLVRSHQLRKSSIIRLTEFVCVDIQNRKVIMIIELDVVLDKCDPIGIPKRLPVLPSENQSGSATGKRKLLHTKEKSDEFAEEEKN